MEDKKITKSGFVSIVGAPNVGKSTLVNALVGSKVSIVTHKPQTTRNKILAILNTDDSQIIFVDTPGMHRPKTKLGGCMVKSITQAMEETDAVLLVVEPTAKISNANQHFIEGFIKTKIPVLLIINKIDKIEKKELMEIIAAYTQLYDFTSIIPISAIKSDGVNIILEELKNIIPEGPQYFPEDMITDQPERQIAAEIVREKALKTLQDEIPHGIAVEVYEFKTRENGIIDISVNIYCEKDTHKGIIIGKNGQCLKLISTRAREDMESFFDCKIYLQCWVKVKDDWRNSNFLLKNFGYIEN